MGRPLATQAPHCFSRISSNVLQSMHLSAVGRASRRRMPISIGRIVLQMVNGAINFFHKLASPISEDSLEVVSLAFAHIFLALFWCVGRESF